jgi:hypothetical protein
MDLMTVISAENPGQVWQNQGCTASFAFDFAARTRDHRRRIVEGVASGDLNNDGWTDIVTGSGQNIDDSEFYLQWAGILSPLYGSLLDPITRFRGVWIGGGGVQTFLHPPRLQGDLAVEINSGGNGNRSVSVSVVGSKGTLNDGDVNRSGIGAVLRFTPNGGPTSTRPVVGGSSYGSQDSLTTVFGLGTASRGTLDVLWPGGTRNRLHNVQRNERLTLPEIPCSIDTDESLKKYTQCVAKALDRLEDEDVIDRRLQIRLLASAILAYLQEH